MINSDIIDAISVNPVGRAILYTGATILRGLGLRPKIIVPQEMMVLPVVVHDVVPASVVVDCIDLMVAHKYKFEILAGISAAVALLMAAVCKYMVRDMSPKDQLQAQEYADCTSHLHFISSFAMMIIPFAHYPVMTGTLIISGTAVFSGSMYYCAFTGERRIRSIVIAGVILMVAGWISLVA
ncbi:GL14894 [Drosophila persimilis]|uniref:GL14894 n=1 Tax=Drosophila persimilis TaxID=7234 RepID=B4H0B6_DROPE|nr:transmembrane protein 256 [Drosophila persimilis]XP_026848263.1 transmembrane protein 256 [Drosophila persimilis]EDW29711.1 GL14894 [Drosophila persimilis]